MNLEDNFVDYSYQKKDIGKLDVKNEHDLEYINSVSSAMLYENKLYNASNASG